MRRVAAVALAGCLAVMSACGSTVSPRARSAANFDGTSNATRQASDAPSAEAGSNNTTRNAVAGSANGTTQSAARTRDTSAGLVGSTRTAGANQPIKLGLMYSTDTNAALSAIGAKTTTGDGRQIQDALIAYVNKNGGVAGHALQAAYHDVSATDSPSDISQKACEQWTHDDHVFAAIPTASVEDNNLMRTCLTKAGVPAIYPNFYTETPDAAFGETPLWFEAESLSLEAWARVYAAGLASQGFFKNARVGLLYDDGPAFTRTVQQVLLPALREAGANVVATATDNIHGAADLAPGSSEMSAAVLQFRSATVTHVLIFEVWQGWFLFARQAQSQGWKPTYGLSTQNAAQIMIESGLLATEQLVDSKLVGWNPGVDVPVATMGSWPRKTLCEKIYKDANIDISTGSAETNHGGLAMCAAFLALLDAGHVLQQPVSPQSLARALEGLGSSLQPANLVSGRFGAGRHYAADAWRPGAYDPRCTCFRYTGPASSIS